MNIVTRSITPEGPIAPDRTIRDVIVAHAERTPDAAAILSHGRPPLTYFALAREIDTVRETLNGWGIGRGDRVASIIASRPEALVAYLCLASATTVIPLNPQATAGELKTALTQIRTGAVVVSEGLTVVEGVVRDLGLAVLRLSPKSDEAAGSFHLTGGTPGRATQPGPADSADVAVIQMTSGTTSMPKAAPLSHALVTRRGAVEVAAIGLTARDVGINFRPAYLSGPLSSGLMAPLTAGGGVVVLEDFNADAFYRDLRGFGITWYTGGPVYHEALLEHAPVYLDVIERSRLRFIRSSSYRLPPDLLHRLETTFGVVCIEKYGGLETGVITRNPPPPARRKPGTVGVPFQCDVAILDHDGRSLPAGEEGQIAVRGPSVFTGYEDDAQATASALVDGWYRTGDIGRFDEDGYVTVCGRISEVINRGGQKVAPNEVEAALASHEDVRDCICFPFPHRILGHVVGAAVVPREGSDVDEVVLRKHIRAQLAQFKVPDLIVKCEEVPRGPDGKLERLKAAARLGLVEASPPQAESHAPKTVTPKRTALVTTLAALWCDVLQLDSIGEDENFTLLGGDSLRAARLFAMVEEVYGVDLPKDMIFSESTTVTGMANAIMAARRQNQTEAGEDAPPESPATIPLRDPAKPCPLTASQHRIWFLSKLDPSDHLYNHPGAIRLKGRVDPELLRQALNEIVARHEILRAYFPLVDGVPRQVFTPTLTLDLPVTDLRPLSKSLREAEFERLVRVATEKPFDLDRGPLIRSQLIVISDDEYLLLLPKHHMIWDGGSNGILYREITAIYRALASGQAVSLPPLPVQYGDFAAWQNDRLKGDHLDHLLEYWRSHLDGAPTIIELPSDRPRSPVQTYEGARLQIKLPRDLVDRLRSVGARYGASLFSVALAAFQVLIHRLTGQDDFIIGTAVNDRIPGQTEDLIGFFINTLPIRATVKGSAAFTEQLAAVQNAVVKGLQCREIPLERIVEELNPSRSEGCQPLVQVLFGFMPRDLRIVEHAGLRFERFDTDLGTARFDLSVILGEDRGTLEGLVEYRTNLFDKDTIVRLMGIYQTLLSEIAREPERSISDFPLLSASKRQRLVEDWSGAHTPYPSETSIHHLFAEVALQAPDALAVHSGEKRLTYGELDRWSNRLAHRLRAEGVGPETVVAISAERSPALIAGLLAILKAGGGYLPLDPSLPEHRIRFMLEDAGVALCLVQDGSVVNATATEAGIRAIEFADGETDLMDQPADAVADMARPGGLAYIVFTSGSIGQPKGVCAVHRGVVRLVRNTDYAQFGPDEVFLQLAPVSFDASTFEIWGCLLNGGTLVQAPAETPSLSELANLIETGGITTLWLTAGLFHQMVDHELDCFRNVRQLLAGGDVLSVDHVRRFVRSDPGCRLINGYGPTENTTFTCAHTVTDIEMLEPSVPIGRPIANTRVYILDEKRNPVPIGIEGELYTGGDGLARGYLNRPELTAERFIPDPFDPRPGARMYRTGDRARFLSNGLIQFLGRIDDQVKIRGFRVEPGEVEAALCEHPKIGQAAVLARDDQTGGTSLIAFLTPKVDGNDPDIQDIRRFLEERLPRYMIPSAFVPLETIPLTENGKIDRERLLDIERPGSAERGPRIAPRTPVEQILGNIWCELLGIDEVGIEDNFFDLGGHSLVAMRVVFRISQETGEELPLQAVFEKPTIRMLALEITERMLAEEQASSNTVPLGP